MKNRQYINAKKELRSLNLGKGLCPLQTHVGCKGASSLAGIKRAEPFLRFLKWTWYTLFPLLLGLWAYYRTDGFHPWKLSPAEGSTSTEGSSLLSLLDQPYHYLDHGRQSFAFESADGQYVIKFFDRTYSQLPFWLAFLPKDRAERERAKRNHRAQLCRTGYQIAFDALRQESGLIALHFEATEQLPMLRLWTKAGRELQIDPNKTAFVLQKRAQPFADQLAATNEAFRALLDLRIDCGIGDYEHHIDRNFGWLGERPIFLDPGRFYYNVDLKTAEYATKERELFIERFEKWRRRQ